jgi:hypothetical protein
VAVATIDESHELSSEDRELLARWKRPDFDASTGKGREVVLVGRLQRYLGIKIVDGQYGPRTAEDYRRRVGLLLGPELAAIVRAYEDRFGLAARTALGDGK